jgi:protein O-mannosyl-transferase
MLPALLCAVVLIVYGNSLGLGLAMDSVPLLQDPRIQSLTAENLGRIVREGYSWDSPRTGLYRPLTTLSLLVNYALLGGRESALPFHLVNVLLHAANVCLVYWLVLGLWKASWPGKPEWPAFFTAALWAAHPVGVESVTNVAGRGDLLATAAVLGGLIHYARGRHPAWLFPIALAGMFAKESAIVLLALMLLADLVLARDGVDARRRVASYGAVGAAAAIVWYARLHLPGMIVPYVDNPMIGADFWTARLTAIKVIGRYLGLMVFPLRLASDYSYNEVPLARGADAGAILSLLVVAGILGAAIARRRRDRILFFAAGFFGITLLPTSNLVIAIGSIMAERFLYLPSIGFALAASVLIYRLGGKRAAAIAGVLAAVYGARSFARNSDWDDNVALWTANAKAAPGSFKTQRSLATILAGRGDQEGAAARTEAAYRILEPLPDAELPQTVVADLGAWYRTKGERAGGAATAEGRQWYEKAIPILRRGREADRVADRRMMDEARARGTEPPKRLGYPALYAELGNVYLKLGRTADALEACLAWRAVEPHNPAVYVSMAAVHIAAGDRQKAVLALMEQSLVGAGQPNTAAQLNDLYRQIPGGECAFSGGKLDSRCPKVKADLCVASGEMFAALVEARMKGEAEERRTITAEKYGCGR